jgi:hypothetical protein
MFGGFMTDDEQTVVLSVAQVAEMQDELYSILEAVRSDPVLSAKVNRVIKRLEKRPERSLRQRMNQAIEEEQLQMMGFSKLMMQAQQQCQQ